MTLPPAYSNGVALNYTTAEQSTGVLWVDGKMIFRKTIDLGALPDTGTKNVAHGLTNYVPRFMEGMADNGSGLALVLPNVNTASVAPQVSIFWNAVNIDIVTGSDRTAFSGHLTLYYTKT